MIRAFFGCNCALFPLRPSRSCHRVRIDSSLDEQSQQLKYRNDVMPSNSILRSSNFFRVDGPSGKVGSCEERRTSPIVVAFPMASSVPMANRGDPPIAWFPPNKKGSFGGAKATPQKPSSSPQGGGVQFQFGTVPPDLSCENAYPDVCMSIAKSRGADFVKPSANVGHARPSSRVGTEPSKSTHEDFSRNFDEGSFPVIRNTSLETDENFSKVATHSVENSFRDAEKVSLHSQEGFGLPRTILDEGPNRASQALESLETHGDVQKPVGKLDQGSSPVEENTILETHGDVRKPVGNLDQGSSPVEENTSLDAGEDFPKVDRKLDEGSCPVAENASLATGEESKMVLECPSERDSRIEWSKGSLEQSNDDVRAASSPLLDYNSSFPPLGTSSTTKKGGKSNQRSSRREPIRDLTGQSLNAHGDSSKRLGLSKWSRESRDGREVENLSYGRCGLEKEGQTSINRRSGPEFKYGGQGGGGRDADGDESSAIDSLGRTMTKILRHGTYGLRMRPDGYVDVRDLLKLPLRTRSNRPLTSHTLDDILKVVRQDNKQRFGVMEENSQVLIRARQGHSVKSVESEHLLKPILSADEVPVCVHGTYMKNLDLICRDGLKRMGRNHVHFASGTFGEHDVISGMRSTSDVLIYLDVRKALDDGMKLYISENRVILTEGFDGVVPVEYFAKVLDVRGNRLITAQSVRSQIV